MESDPIGQKGALNTYTYASNNPIYWTDSMGTFNDNSLCGGLPLEIQIDCREHFFPKPKKPNKCKRKCWLVAVGSCSGVGFYAGSQAFAVCMMTTGVETIGGSTPICAGVGVVTGQVIGKACKIHFQEKCEEVNNCCNK